MKKSRGILSLLATIIVAAAIIFVAVLGIGSSQYGSASSIKLGLDLAGGVSITYQAVESDVSSQDMNDTKEKLRKRVESYSTESEVYLQGDDRITVEIPGVNDANAILAELGQPGTLVFIDSDGEVVLEGTDIQNAEVATDQDTLGNTEYVVSLTMTSEGTEKFTEATTANLGKTISIVYDGEVISSPTVSTAITTGKAVINGMADYEEAESLATTIRIGALPVELTELRSEVVGAKLGEEAINTSLMAALIGICIIAIFMIVMYRIPGLAASIALIIYTSLMIVMLSAFEITLTLPGIAGIVLSIGMAVDANVIIFARIREEISAGKTVRSAMKTGFNKALSAIVDGNITTLIAAIVLAFLGSGTVKGFAQTLALGTILSMFTALVITRFILNALYACGFYDKKFYGVQKERKTINFLSKKNICFSISGVLIALGFVFMFINANSADKGNILNYSLEFQGGTSTTVTFNEDYSKEQIDKDIVPVVKEALSLTSVQFQKVEDSTQVVFKTSGLTLEEREAFNAALVESFGVDETLIESQSISPTISGEMKQDAILAVVIATLCMLIYIWFRFSDIKFAASAVLALLHDVLIVLAFYVITRISVSSTFIACMLTIVGYSINATIIIFDRIRENLREKKNKDSFADIVNASITQTLSRSINTSFTTFVMVAALYVFGVSSIGTEFALPFMVGVVAGAYSSVCITGALWYTLTERFSKKAAK